MTDNQVEGNEQREVTTAVDEVSTLGEKGDLVENQSTGDDFEEGRDVYRPGGFHPVYLGDIYNDRYQIMRKIGYGQYSTVWLVKDLTQLEGSKHEFRALKVLSAVSYGEDESIYEREILSHLREADKTHLGYKHVCHLVDDFEHQGPNGNHVCLVFELIGETLRTFRVWFENQLLPNPIMRKFATQLLMALDYAHDNGIIHTDIKPDNIFVQFRDISLISKYLVETTAVQQDKHAKSYSTLRSQSLKHFYFLTSDSPMEFNILLGDWGVSSWTTKHLCKLIQPIKLRSPEVLIRAPWDWTTDWWNLGTVILEVFRGVMMFTGKDDQYTPYKLKTHLEEIVDFFGPFPRSLLDQGASDIVQEMFNEDGTVKDSEPLHRPGLLSDVYMEDLPQDTREEFVAFLHALMKIDPKERLPTMDILMQPWIRYYQYKN